MRLARRTRSFAPSRAAQNNGRIAHQLVDHVHFHVIPKPGATDEAGNLKPRDDAGLVIGWPQQTVTKEELAKVAEEVKGKL